MIKRLKIYAGDKHPHEAQQPEPWNFKPAKEPEAIKAAPAEAKPQQTEAARAPAGQAKPEDTAVKKDK